jgi:hypothetical protein
VPSGGATRALRDGVHRRHRACLTSVSKLASLNKSTSGADSSKAEEGGEIAATLPSGYSRGEGQKPVSKAYKDNWDAIFAKKKKR